MNDKNIYFDFLYNFIDITKVPFTARGSRLLVMKSADGLVIRQSREPRIAESKSAPDFQSDLLSNLKFRDEFGDELPVVVQSQPHILNLETKLGEMVLVFEDTETILLSLPENSIRIEFEVSLRHAKADWRGAEFTNTGVDRFRMAYTTNKPILGNSITKIENDRYKIELELDKGPGSLKINITPRLGLNRYIPEINPIVHRAAQEWYDWFERVPKVEPHLERYYYYAWWVMRAGLMSTRYFLTREALASSKMHSTSVWQWDAFLHACAFRFVDRKLSHDQIRILLDHQLEDGMIPAAVHDNGIVINREQLSDIEIKNPPMLAWTVLRIYRSDGDKEFLAEIYEKLSKWNSWWLGQFQRNSPDFEAAESINDFDDDTSDPFEKTKLVGSPDLNTYLYLQIRCMAEIASALDRTDETIAWNAMAEDLLGQMRDALQDSQSGLLWTYQQGIAVCVPTPASLLPLIVGEDNDELSHKALEHFRDNKGIWQDSPVPSIALDDPKFQSEEYWKGPSWVSMNLLLMEGLDRSGNSELANQLCERTLERMLAGISRASKEDENTDYAPIFGWAASLLIEFAIRSSRQKIKNS
ncbi:MAG TPA: trehalase family glycosidase [Bellilinea sp.]|nr:trehalase family glycosidase [Bellilinea sp.]